jgi:hypothetical protein
MNIGKVRNALLQSLTGAGACAQGGGASPSPPATNASTGASQPMDSSSPMTSVCPGTETSLRATSAAEAISGEPATFAAHPSLGLFAYRSGMHGTLSVK